VPYHGLSKLSYPFHDRTITVTQCIWIREGSRSLAKTQLGSWQETGLEEITGDLLEPDFWIAAIRRIIPTYKYAMI